MKLDNRLKSVLPLSMMSYFFISCWAFLIPLIQRQLGFLYIEIGIVVAASTLISLVGRLFFGHIADRFGPKLIFRISSLFLSVSSIFVFLAYDLISFTIASTLYLFSTAMIYWTSMLVINSNRKRISTWLSMNNLGSFLGFVTATTVSVVFDPRILFAIISILPIFNLRIKDIEIKTKKKLNIKPNRKLLILSVAGFFMVFQVSIWSNFLPIYLENILPSIHSYMSTGIFLAFDSLFFTFVFYFSGKVDTRLKGAAMVSLMTLIFTSIVSAIPLLPLLPFFIMFIFIRNMIIAFRMIGVAEMVKRKEMGNFDTQIYSTSSSSASIIAPYIGGMIADSIGLEYVFYLSAPFGIISAILFLI